MIPIAHIELFAKDYIDPYPILSRTDSGRPDGMPQSNDYNANPFINAADGR
jgi:hypothetical protein